MNRKLLIIMALVVISCVATIGVAIAGTISGTIEALYGGSPVVSEPLGTIIQLHCSFSDIPASNGEATVYYKFSTTDLSKAGWKALGGNDITSISSWSGTEQVVPFTLNQQGFYRFYLEVDADSGDSVTVQYPASGSFLTLPTPSVLPEAPPIAALAIGFAAVGLFVVVTKKRTKQ